MEPLAPRPGRVHDDAHTRHKDVIWLLWTGGVLLACIVALTPVTYDTLHLEDTVFIAQIAQYVSNGEVPGKDFDHLYGGAHEQVIAWAYALFGNTVKALDYTLVLYFLMGMLGLLLFAWRRLDAMTTASISAILAVVIFARQPFEEHALVQHLTAAHSFTYNRIGTALVILATVAMLIPADRSVAQIAGAALAGLCLTLAILTKATFFPVFIALALGFALLKRYRELTVFCVATVLCALILDPSGARIFGTLLYSVEAAGGNGGFGALLRKAFSLIWSQQVYVLMLSAVLILFWRLDGLHSGRIAFTAILVLAGFWATTVTMGPSGLLGQPALPMISAIAVLLWSAARSLNAQNAGRIGPLAAILVAALILPQALNTVGTAAKSVWNREHIAFEQGRLAGYLAQGTAYRDHATGRELIYPQDRAAILVETKRRLLAGEHDAGVSYIQLAEAVRLLEDLPGITDMGLVDDAQLGVSFALGLPRVEGFPTWMRPNSPEFSTDFMRDVGLVLLGTTGHSRYNSVLRAQMGDFILCRQNALWELHIRADQSSALSESCQNTR